MKSNTVLKDEGMRILANSLGIVDAERFITLIRREPFNYTEWKQSLFADVPLESFLADADEYRKQKRKAETLRVSEAQREYKRK